MGTKISMNEVKDRVPTNPGRVLITPESGVPYYATVTMADDPTEDGTAINQALFNSMEVEIPEGVISIPSTTGTNTYVATVEGYTEYKTNQPIVIMFTAANTGLSTLNINGLGAKSIVRGTNTALIANEIMANSVHLLIYGGTYFHLISLGTIAQNANQANTANTAGYASAFTANRTLSLLGVVTGSISSNFSGSVSLTTSFATAPLTAAIKSIQSGTLALTSSNWMSSNSISITAVNGTKSIIFAYTDAAGYYDGTLGRFGTGAVVKNATVGSGTSTTSATVSLTLSLQGTPPTSTLYFIQGNVYWTVIEFN